eukprot:Plantae.Rhodophyta-Hildenbrandia_rubra.ctg19783.p1 GENE.Plantae.Rhodophyta-Hildenbrandia_rubra.ctg19783~~Plantae.Rhodophyta-Hildenbrandia_rubra.ctg19783.p1  ORF type:complete len:407 (+),score=99.23 Plantae.Rhodophyta-Hildenbrandia_rubra.ctg19783:40-1221(+)
MPTDTQNNEGATTTKTSPVPASTTPSKRSDGPSLTTRAHRRRRRRYKSTCNHVNVQDLGVGNFGVLVTCEPKHESQCSGEAVGILGEVAEEIYGGELRSRFEGGNDGEKVGEDGVGKNVEKELGEELKMIKRNGGLQGLQVFTRMDIGIKGSVFLRVGKDVAEKVKVEVLVSRVLEEAKKTGFANCRHCVRFVPVHSTCKATAENAAEAVKGVLEVVKPVGKTYAIIYRGRNNSSAHRKDYIEEIAKVVDGLYKVDLSKPDWVLIVEVLRTSCCVGVFDKYFELGKMNVRECANPTVKKKGKESEVKKGEEKDVEASKLGKVQNRESVDKIKPDKSEALKKQKGDVEVAEPMEKKTPQKTKPEGKRSVNGTAPETKKSVTSEDLKAAAACSSQ